MIQITPQLRILVAIEARLSKGRFPWWPTGAEASRSLRAHQVQLLLAGGDPETEAAPIWRRVSV